MKKVLIFSTAYLPLVGGAEVAVKEITDRLGDDFVFDLICARIEKHLPAREKIGRINIFRLGCGCFLDKYYLALGGHFFAAKLHKKNNYNAIWAVMASFGGFAAMFFKKKNPAVPFLLTLQEGDPIEYIKKRVGIFSGWFAQIFTRADYVQAISNFLADWAKSMGAKCTIEVAPNGVDVEKFSQGVILSEAKNLKKKLSIKDDEKIIITASRLVKKNAIDDLIRAAARLTAKVVILGDGPDRKTLEDLAASLRVGDRVVFFGEYDNNDLPKYLAISDVFVRPSLSEGQGISFLEAMAAGVPIIGTPVGGIPDFLRDGETGLFCEARNPESVAEQISRLLADEALRQKLIVNGRRLVEEKYNWDKIVQQMAAIFTRLARL